MSPKFRDYIELINYCDNSHSRESIELSCNIFVGVMISDCPST